MPTFRPHPVDWTEEKVTRFWDFLATHHQGEFFSQKHSRDLAAAILRVSRPGVLLDIGCGTGPLLIELARRGIQTIGVDTSSAALDEVRARSRGLDPAPMLRLGAAGALPIDDASVDFATMIEVVEHLDDQALRLALAEARRALKVGGILMITTPNEEDLPASKVQCPDCGSEFHLMQHVRRWTAPALSAVLVESGFAPKSIRPVRLVENGPINERFLRRIYYRFGSVHPRLLAYAIRLN